MKGGVALGYHVIDMSTYPRQAHFAYFNAMPDPYVGVTVDGVHIGAFYDRLREELDRFAEDRS